MEYSLGFSPLIPVPMLIAALIFALVLGGLYIAQGSRAAILRLLALLVLVLALAGPSLIREERESLRTVVALVIDQSESQSVGDRREQTEEARALLAERLGDIDAFDIREVVVSPAFQGGDTDVTTAMISALQSALEDVPPSRIGGAVLVTDGQVHDVPQDKVSDILGGDYPIHALITGTADEFDRRIVLEQSPRFGIVGESQQIVYRVEDQGAGQQPGRETIVKIYIDGELISEEFTLTGQQSEFYFEVPNAGRVIVELEAETLDGELTEINNRAFADLAECKHGCVLAI
jgi:hypothetical protein